MLPRFRHGFLLALCCPLVFATDPKAHEAAAGAAFLPARYLDHVKFLADDALGGRDPGTPGVAVAADYVSQQFAAAGLEPAGVDGTWFQPFTIKGDKRFDREAAQIRISGLDRAWKVEQDWVPFPFTKPGDFEGPLAFAGYGVSAPESGYDDYTYGPITAASTQPAEGDPPRADTFDARGKVLLIFRYEPRSGDPEADFGGETRSAHSLFTRKARVAAEHGAKALLIVDPPGSAAGGGDERGDEAGETENGLYRWSRGGSRRSYELPMAQISRAMADTLLAHAQMPPAETLARELERGRQSLSCDLHGVRVEARTGVTQPDIVAKNVLGVLPGAGDADDYVVVGGHYDHVGNTVPNRSTDDRPQIHNGADDNASGTAGLIELARVLAQDRPRRSVLFIAFSAEERGLLGSKHFVDAPTVPLEQIRTMINFDMIGRLAREDDDTEYTVFGIPTAREFDDLVKRSAEEFGLEYSAPSTRARIFGASDHYPFYRKNIPVLFATTGLHPQYHRPDDDWPLIDAEGATRVLGMMCRVLTTVANMDSGPQFVPEAEQAPSADASRRDEDGASPRDEDDALPMPRVRFGFMPAYGDEGPGVLVEEVVPDGPAARAGMKELDRILRIADKDVADIYGYMDALRGLKPDDEVDVRIRRAEEERTLRVKLEAWGGRG